MTLLRRKGSQKYFWTFIWSGVGTVLLGWASFRRMGFGTEYPRICYLATSGEYRTLLEPGAIPDNPYLPPHLRLDMRSYLDPIDCRIACPPEYDLTMSQRDMKLALQDILPPEERREFEVGIGPLKSRGILTSIQREERFINRRLGMPQEMKDRAPRELDM
jgi:hypothetical protein